MNQEFKQVRSILKAWASEPHSHAEVTKAVGNLTFKQAQAINLKFTGKLKINEIADKLGIIEASVKKRMQYAYKNLAKANLIQH